MGSVLCNGMSSGQCSWVTRPVFTAAAPAHSDPIIGLSAPRQITLTLQMIDANIANPMRIKDLAAAAGLSPNRFSRAFRRSVGELPRRYLHRRRIEFAQELMLSTPKTLAEIALDCGLCDQAHLTRTFHRMVGVSPSAWRRSRRGGASR